MTSDTRQYNWNAFRRLMPVTRKWTYFDHAAVAPLPQPALQAMREWAEDVAAHGDVHWGRWRQQIEDVRTLGARMLHADTDEIALIRNTTEGISLIAEGFPWQPGENVVVPECEFPSNLYPWKNLQSRGVEVRLVPAENERLDPATVDSTCDRRTRIVAVSWVGYATGWRNDLDALAEIAHRHGALLFVDGIQGLGVLPLDVGNSPIDFLAADGHKWLLGPEGAGLLFVRRAHLDMLRPLGVGWNSVETAGDYGETEMRLKQSAGRYEGGTYGVGPLLGLGASLKLLLDVGVPDLAQRLLQITDELCHALSEIGAEIASCRDRPRKSGIVAFTLPGQEPNEIRRRCRDNGIVVNCRAGCVRISPHVYASEEDVRRFGDLLRRLG